jgi:uncharacterized spore protein YtfJ
MKNVEEILAGAKDAMTVRKVFGDPYEKDGVTVIPAATIRGGWGGGGGSGHDEEHKAEGSGFGGGFGVYAKPAGAYIVKDGDVRWEPAVDPMRPVIAAQAVAIAALLAWRTVARVRGKGKGKD